MINKPKAWPFIVISLMLAGIVIASGFFLKNLNARISIYLAGILILGYLIYSYIRASWKAAIIEKLINTDSNDKDTLANSLLSEIIASGIQKKSIQQAASEIIKSKFGIDKFVIYFRDDDKLIPRIYSNVNIKNLGYLNTDKIKKYLGSNMDSGIIFKNDTLFHAAAKNNDNDEFESYNIFAFSWGKGGLILIIFDDTIGHFTEILKNADMNKMLWPGLDYTLRVHFDLKENAADLKQNRIELGRAKKELIELNKELNKKMLDVQSFVKISNDLYSLFNEDQLFPTLKNTISNQLGATKVEILKPSGDGTFKLSAEATGNSNSGFELILDSESALLKLLQKSAKPLLMPLVGSGLSPKEPFLDAAAQAGFQIASPIKVSGRIECIILVGEKKDKGQYLNQDIDSFYSISNIASLALENIKQYSTIEKLSYTDSMTGIYNYRYFYKRLSEEILRAQRYNREIALVIMDIDNFKTFNDNFGHQAGDMVLKQLSELITRTIRSIDVVSRYGGEEFCIIMPDTGTANCSIFIERLRAEIAGFKFESEASHINSITVSVGGAVYPYHGTNPDRLIYCSDMALLKAKSSGRNRALMYSVNSDDKGDLMSGRSDVAKREYTE